jgi:hypothetical protein
MIEPVSEHLESLNRDGGSNHVCRTSEHITAA